MASTPSVELVKSLKEISPIRAMVETLMNNNKVRKINIAEAYELAKKQTGVSVTDMPIYPEFARKHGLPQGATVLNDCHGKIVGRTAKARRFYNRLNASDKTKVEGDLSEAILQMQQYPLIKAEAVLGLTDELMIKATFVTTETDAMNVFNWLCNFAPMESMAKEYAASKKLPIMDIILVAFNEWTCNDTFYNNVGQPQLALVDEKQNVIINLGMRYFGERKKGTLTLGWTSAMTLGMAACHGGIKEIDFSKCDDASFRPLGKRSIVFYGLSGTGKSSHTNSPDNAGTLPKGFDKAVLHDDAFQIDLEKRMCRVWEPTLFDKTDSRDINNPDWKYTLSLMNHSQFEINGKNWPVGLDIRNSNGRALLDRDLLGKWVNECSFPMALAWLMKDTVLPPIIKFSDHYLAIAMGAALITMRNKAENVTEEELKKLVFEPFANPFRVYELYKDVEAFFNVVESGADVYSFNSRGYWRSSDSDLEGISLTTSLTLQTAILTDKLQWEPWKNLPGAMIPTKESIDAIIPGYYDKYDPAKRQNMEQYITLLKDRFAQRRDFLNSTDVNTKPELLNNLVGRLEIKA
ncbi:MAG TPA: phosphoenolpyruvate carboxykinase (ATP) [Candidatus Cloacimonadota bacterium]|nr:phosphoenolpyruvate carboxykinase (ATP) [Candidatus Cloacimonadota bacterium]HPT72328.1 phosphoenolpyruvate carboxykinase (ATP) [Candidatus Cloacimonadota bacterium]